MSEDQRAVAETSSETAAATSAATTTETAAPAARPRFDDEHPRVIDPVEIILDRPRHLRFPWWALKRFQDKTGVSPWDAEKVLRFPPDIDMLTAMLWVGLLDEDPDLTYDQVARMPGLEFGNIYYILRCLDRCWGLNSPAADPQPVNGTAGGTDPNARSGG